VHTLLNTWVQTLANELLWLYLHNKISQVVSPCRLEQAHEEN
jgi:hypothetical protein